MKAPAGDTALRSHLTTAECEKSRASAIVTAMIQRRMITANGQDDCRELTFTCPLLPDASAGVVLMVLRRLTSTTLRKHSLYSLYLLYSLPRFTRFLALLAFSLASLSSRYSYY